MKSTTKRKKNISIVKKTPAKKVAAAVIPVIRKKVVHYTAPYLINPQHPVTINVIGCGGTGSQVLNSLARMHSALKALGHPGLFIRAIDPDKVSDANMGRQLFSPSDVGSYKCMVLIGRINRFFGTDWEAIPVLYDMKAKVTPANITVSCVDSGPARKEIKAVLVEAVRPPKLKNPDVNKWLMDKEKLQPYQQPYYWLDFGNKMDRGQAVIGTLQKIKQPKSDFLCRETLPTIDKLHPEIFRKSSVEDQGPSCSLAEALQKQDLFINTNLANMGLGIIWKMFREAMIQYNGLYVNLDSLNVNPIKIA